MDYNLSKLSEYSYFKTYMFILYNLTLKPNFGNHLLYSGKTMHLLIKIHLLKDLDLILFLFIFSLPLTF